MSIRYLKVAYAAGARRAALTIVLAVVTRPVLNAQVPASRDTATRTDTARTAKLPELKVTAERARAAPPPTTTIEVDPEVLRRTQAVNAYDLVRRVTGVEVHDQGQGPGYASNVVLRGFSADHSSDVLLTIDGVPINLPVHGHVEGYADWSVLSPAAVSSFRIISGTASPLYGDFALGGVAEVFTLADADGIAGAVSGSTYGDAGGWIRRGQRFADGGYVLAVDGQREQGWRDNSQYWLGNGLARGWRRLGSGRLEGGLAVYGSSWNSPGFLSVEQYNAGALEGAMDRTDGGSAHRIIGHGRLTSTLGTVGLDASTWVQRVRSSVYLTVPEDGLLNQSDEEDERWAFGGRVQIARPFATGDLSAGVDGQADFATYALSRTDQRERVSPTKSLDGRYLGGGAFVRARTLVGSHLALDAGARADVLHYRSLDRLAATPWREATATVIGPKLGARWIANGSLTLLASVSRGFRGAPGVIEDPSIAPIEAWTKELGIQYQVARLRLHLAAFRLDVRNERIQDPITREISAAGESVRQGLNGEAELRLGQRMLVFAEATVNDAAISGAPAGSDAGNVVIARSVAHPEFLRPNFHIEPLAPGDPIPSVARYVGRLGLEGRVLGSLVGRSALRFSGPYTPIGEPSVLTKSYALIDLGASVPLALWHATLDLSLDNLLSAKYPEVRASGYLNPGAPRTLRVAFNFTGRP